MTPSLTPGAAPTARMAALFSRRRLAERAGHTGPHRRAAWLVGGTVAATTVVCLMSGGSAPSTAARSTTAQLATSSTSSEEVAAQRIADALLDPRTVDPGVATSVGSIISNQQGWLLLVAADEYVGLDEAAEICAALAQAGVLPSTRTFVVDHQEHQLVRGC